MKISSVQELRALSSGLERIALAAKEVERKLSRVSERERARFLQHPPPSPAHAWAQWLNDGEEEFREIARTFGALANGYERYYLRCGNLECEKCSGSARPALRVIQGGRAEGRRAKR